MSATAETFLDGKVTLYPGDCLAVLDGLADNAIDACVVDPPYHLASIVKRFGKEGSAEAKDYTGERAGATGAYVRSSRGFMGKQWDGGDIAFRPETWAKVLRVLKPGAHLVAFAAPKNVGHLQVAIEAAGFETRDCILDLIDLDPLLRQFIASLNDAQRGALFRLIDEGSASGMLAWLFGSGFPKSHNISLDFERELCRSIERGGRQVWIYNSDGADMVRTPPFRDPRANEWIGTGTALKPAFEPIVLARKAPEGTVAENCLKWGTGALNIDAARINTDGEIISAGLSDPAKRAGVFGQALFDGKTSKEAFQAAPRASLERANSLGRWPADIIHNGSPDVVAAFPQEEAGSAPRFFYTAKADSNDRLGSKHPTVKPLDLIEYLIRLVTRPGQTILDPFAGTGTAGEAAFRQGRRAVLIEREPEYQNDIRRRMRLALGGPEERARESIKAGGKTDAAESLPLFGGVT
jgi:site-specific DNA-methyltransferase (adenine-specific)